MRVQMLVETHRRLGNISERAAFEVYQQLEACLGAYKAMERIVSTPIPFTYLHMLQFILFFFVFSAPFVFTTTGFHWIAIRPVRHRRHRILRHQRDGQTHRGPVRLEAALPRPRRARTPRVPTKISKSTKTPPNAPIATRNPRQTPRPNAPAKDSSASSRWTSSATTPPKRSGIVRLRECYGSRRFAGEADPRRASIGPARRERRPGREAFTAEKWNPA